MKFYCSKRELLDGLSIVQMAITGRTTLPILEGILITAKNGQLTLTATDLDLGIETKIPCNVISAGSVVLNARLFGELIRKLPDMDIEIEVDSSYNTSIRWGKSRLNLVAQSGKEYPELPVIKDNIMYKIPQNILKNMIKQVIFATAQDMTRPVLTGVLFEINDGVLTLVAIDGYRVALRKSNIDSTSNINAIIPGKTLNEVSKILAAADNEVSITFTPNHILFTIGNIRIISRLLDGEFLNYRRFIPDEYKTRVRVNVRELLDCVERASLLAKESKTNRIKINIRNSNITITSNSQIGDIYEEIPVIMEGNELEIGLNSRYIMDVLKIIDAEEVYLEMTNSLSPFLVKTIEDENYTYLVIPVRLDTR